MLKYHRYFPFIGIILTGHQSISSMTVKPSTHALTSTYLGISFSNLILHGPFKHMQQNLNLAPFSVRLLVHKTLIWPKLEHTCAVWYPHQTNLIKYFILRSKP